MHRQPGGCSQPLACHFAAGKHAISATVEVDAVCAAVLASRARQAGVIYSMAYGDQPAMVSKLVDWARTCGFSVAAAGRGHKWKPEYRFSTPDTVWDHWGVSREQAERGRLNPKMFDSLSRRQQTRDRSTAIANACGLDVPRDELLYPAGSIDDIPALMRPQSEGGALEKAGMVEVINSLQPDGSAIDQDIRMGVWVCVEAVTDYQQACFDEYKVVTDEGGRYMAMVKRWHLIGLELGLSVANVGLRGEATGTANGFRADTAAGEVLDGAGG